MSHKLFKEETKELHSRLDQSSFLKNIMSNQVTVKDYLNFLHFHCISNDLLQSQLKEAYKICGWSFTIRKEKLQKDIAAVQKEFSVDGHEFKIESKVKNKIEPSLGLVYVMEGARHGNKYIYQHLKRKLNLDDGACQFLLTHSKIEWSTITSQLDALSETEKKYNLLQAQNTFSFLINISNSIKDKIDEKHQV